MDADDSPTSVAGKRKPYLDYGLLAGVQAGLVTAAVLGLAYAWVCHTPGQPFAADRSDVTSMLWRATLVVLVSVVLTAVYFAVGRVYYRSSSKRAQFLGRTAGPLVVLAIAGAISLHHGKTAAVFDAAAGQQLGLSAIGLTFLARTSWWCACVAVLILALVSALCPSPSPSPSSSTQRAAPPPTYGRVIAATAVVVAALLTAGLVVMANRSPVVSQTAARIDPPAAPDFSGKVAYRVDTGVLEEELVPAGAGFVRIVNPSDYSGPDRVEGYDGATGARRWSFSLPDLSAGSLSSTGTGRDSVVVVHVSGPAAALVALDATTGTPLWARPSDTASPGDGVSSGVSSQIVLIDRKLSENNKVAYRTEWTALAPRTGEVLWTKDFPYMCFSAARLTDTAVLMHSCNDGPGVVTEVLDPKTGERLRELRSPETDATAVAPTRSAQVVDALGDQALVAVDSPSPGGQSRVFVVDITSGRVVNALPAGSAAAFIGGNSLALVGPATSQKVGPVAIVDLSTGRTTDTGLVSSAPSRGGYWKLLARNGSQWITRLPDQQEAANSSAPLRAISASGDIHSFPDPCNGANGATRVVAIPGAVVTTCNKKFVALR